MFADIVTMAFQDAMATVVILLFVACVGLAAAILIDILKHL